MGTKDRNPIVEVRAHRLTAVPTPEVAARTLFATHYHELTELALVLPRVVNLRMAAQEHDERIVFLHRLEEGAADQSYGIQVAALAGVPRSVVARAREILVNLETDSVGNDGRPKLARPRGHDRDQLALFAGAAAAPPRRGGRAAAVARRRRPGEERDGGGSDPAREATAAGVAETSSAAATGGKPISEPEIEVLDEVRHLTPDRLSPLEALQILHRLQQRLKKDDD